MLWGGILNRVKERLPLDQGVSRRLTYVDTKSMRHQYTTLGLDLASSVNHNTAHISELRKMVNMKDAKEAPDNTCLGLGIRCTFVLHFAKLFLMLIYKPLIYYF